MISPDGIKQARRSREAKKDRVQCFKTARGNCPDKKRRWNPTCKGCPMLGVEDLYEVGRKDPKKYHYCSIGGTVTLEEDK